jgi:hypothetical protein
MNESTKKDEEPLKRYHELFPDNASKAAAFDEIAEKFYAANFGTMSKTDFETLMFSIYIERILKTGEYEFSQYTDYQLSKQLGISQNKVSNLKVRKQLQYPYDFEWRKSFAEITKNARYEDKKIKIYIPDINLYYEVKNAIEESGGYVDVTLNKTLLQISPEYFFDLLLAISEDVDKDGLRESIRKNLQETCQKNNIDIDFLDDEPFGKKLKDCGIEVIAAVIDHVLPGAGDASKLVMENISSLLKSRLKKNDKIGTQA